ncbi:MAG TPA: LEA type 2 family protein [Chitinophagaceae bacterium]|nr:LEA type 2 family protein [Chitinophagaceae bacterium]
MGKLSVELVLLAGLAAMTSCSHLKAPEYRGVEAVNVGGIGQGSATLALNLHYYNPNNTDLKLKQAEGDAYIDSLYVGHFTLDSLVLIPRLADFTVPINLQADTRTLWRNSLSLLLKKEVLLKLKGTCKVGRGRLFVRYPISYEAKQSLQTLGLFGTNHSGK